MEEQLKDRYAAWLAKHNAPDAHPHRELFDMLVAEIHTLSTRVNATARWQDEIDLAVREEAIRSFK